MASKKETTGSVETKFPIMEWAIGLYRKHGIMNILVSGILLVFMSVMVSIALNPTVVFDKYKEYEELKHQQSFDYRMKSSPAVQAILDNSVTKLNALRAFVIELHNGKANSTGLSFNYGSMTYESLNGDSVGSVKEDYSDFSLDRYPMVMKVYEDGLWYGTVSSVEKIDKKLGFKMEGNEADYMIVTSIYGVKSEIGFFGVTYKGEGPTDIQKAINEVRKIANQLSPLLDGDCIGKE